MNITTWNCNSLRARLDRIVAWVEDHDPDVLCFQELKCLDVDLPREPFASRGYHFEAFGQKSYNGVAILSKKPITDVERGLPLAGDPNARGIAGTVDGIRILNLYCPNGGDITSDKYPYKLGWFDALIELLKSRPPGPFVTCGDFNIAPADADCYDPVGWKDHIHVSVPERERFAALLQAGLTDAFRSLYPDTVQFTWWDYRGGSFEREQGLRIDHHLISPELKARLNAVTVDVSARAGLNASDHAPVTMHLRDR